MSGSLSPLGTVLTRSIALALVMKAAVFSAGGVKVYKLIAREKGNLFKTREHFPMNIKKE